MDDLRRQSQSLCERETLEESRKQDVLRAVKDAEEQWRAVLQAAEEALNKAEAQAALEEDVDAFRSQSEGVQSWIREQKQKLLSLGSHMPFEERLRAAQVSLQIRCIKRLHCAIKGLRY